MPSLTETKPKTVVLDEAGGVGAGHAVDLDAVLDGDEAEDLVAVDRVAAAGHLVGDVAELAVDDQVVVGGAVLSGACGLLVAGIVLRCLG